MFTKELRTSYEWQDEYLENYTKKLIEYLKGKEENRGSIHSEK